MEEEISDELSSVFSSTSLNLHDKSTLYNELIENKFVSIMEHLGLKRYCCRLSMRYPGQYNVGNPNPPPGNIITTRYSKDVQRNPTVIYLTKPSKVPGGSNLNMISLTHIDENLTPFERRLRDIPFEESAISRNGDFIESRKIMEPNAREDTPVHVSGSYKSIKRKPKIKNVEIIGNTTGSDLMDIEVVNSPVVLQAPHELMDIEETDLIALNKLNIGGY